MTEDDLKKLLEACRPTPCILIGSYPPPTPEENANRAWENLGKKMGFDYMTVQPIPGKALSFFSAVPLESEFQRKEREEREIKVSRFKELEEVKLQIDSLELKKIRLQKICDTYSNL
jgi:hypothetical protein